MVIRWLLVPVSAAAIIGICVVAARGAITLVDQRCPPESRVGGACVEPWHTTAVEVTIYTAFVVAALALVIVPSLVAPRLKRAVAMVMLLAGLGIPGTMYYFTSWAELLAPLAVAALAGAIALWWVWRRGASNES